MAEPTSPYGLRDRKRGLALASGIGLFAVVAAVLGGWLRAGVVVVASVGAVWCLGYWLLTSALARLAFRHLRVRYVRTHYFPNIGHIDLIEPAGAGYVYASIYHGNCHDQRDTASADRILRLPNLRCEFRRPWRRKKYLCARVDSTGSCIVRALVPEELLTRADGRARLRGGPYIVRWRCDGRRRALSRLWVGFNELGYRPHPLRRLRKRWQGFRDTLNDPARWPEP